MACEYFVNGEWISENQFKEILIGDESGGLLDALINSGKVEMKGFPAVDAPVRETLRNNTIPVKKLQAMLIKEVKSRKGYPINILSALELNKEGTDFKIPLWSSNYADKFESLLTSIVNNNVIKQKFNGHSYILGSEEGFTLKEGEDAENELSRSGIVYTDSFDPKIGLQPMRIGENGEVLPAQIMIPFNFKNKDQYGNKLKLKDFMIPGTNKVDLSKLDPKMLKLFGFRIPTQGHNSMSTVEIVGFLPEASGDLVLAPKDFTVQMGSDFDVDKLYTYMYNVQLKEGKLTTEFSEDNVIENAQNAILDIHHSVLTNPDSNIVSAILKPDGFGDFKDLSNDVVKARTNAGTLKQTLTILSDSYQKKKFISGTAGKDGVGSFSLDATFNAIIQGKELFFFKPETVGLDKFGKYSRDEQIAMTKDTFTLGNLSSDGDLSNPYTLKSQKILNSVNGDVNKLSKEERAKLKFKSDVIQGLQSSAVDNANEEILDKINIASQTFDAIRGMAQLGFEESEIVGLLTQDIMWEYVDFIKSRRSSLKEEFASGDSYQDFLAVKKKQYDPNGDFDKLTQEQINTLSSKSSTQLIESLNSKQLVDVVEGNSTPLSNLEQFAILDKFIKFSEVGKAIKTVQSTINTESSGLPKNLLETNAKIEQIKRLPLSPIIGATKLLGEFDNNNNLVNPTTINGFAAYHGAILADKMYAKYFPYTTNGFTTQYNELLEHIAGDEISDSKRVDVKINAFKEMRSYLFTSGALNIYDGNAEGVQRRLFIDIPGKHQSLASILKTLRDQNEKSKRWFNNNQFLNKLLFEPRVDGKVSRIDFQAATGENYDEQAIYLGFMQLFQIDNQPFATKFNGEDYTPARLAHELVMYAYLEGGSQGAKSFLKYIPVEYLKSQRFGEGLQSLSSFDYNSIFGGSGTTFNYGNPSRFTVQYFQNNPNNAKKLTLEDIDTNHKSITAVDNFKLKPDAVAGNMASYTNELGEKTNTQTAFVAIYDSKLKSKYALYQYDNVEHVYKRIPVVSGSHGFKQYNINGNITKPVQTANEIVAPNTINVKQPSTPTMNPVPVQPVQGYNPNVMNNPNPIEKVGGLEINRKLGSDAEIITDFFLQIANNPAVPKYYQELAKEYHKLKLPHGIKLQGTNKGKGSYDADSNVLKLNKEELNAEGALETAITILHESTHIFTSAVIKKYPNLKGEQKEAVTRLNGLMNKYIAFLIKSGKGPQREAFRQAYNEWKAAKESGDNTMIPSPEFTKDNINEFYGSIKLEEFVAMAQTSKEFQQILNNVIDSDGKSFLSKMMEQIGKILKSIGINLNKNSLLYSTLESVQTLIDVNQKNVESANQVKSSYELFPGVFANEGQTKALDLLNDFIKSDEKVFLLQGKGGTGKTTIIKKLLQQLPSSDVLGIAPSHKAVKVLKKSINNNDIKTRTLASALAIKLDENTGNFEKDLWARKQNDIPINKANYIIIDEASMISDDLLNEILEWVKPNAKIILMGDKAQLPPVGQSTDSKVFDFDNGYELTEKMRQAATSPIIGIGTIIANNVETKNERLSNPIKQTDRVNKHDDVSGSYLLWESNEDRALDSFVLDFKSDSTNTDNVKVITFNNQNHNNPQSVKNINEKIRSKLYGDKANQQFVIGELVTSYDSFSKEVDDNDVTILNNSDDFIVNSVEKNKITQTIYVQSKAKGMRNFTYSYDVLYLGLTNDEGESILGDIVPVIAESSKQQYAQDLAKLWKTDKQMGFKLKSQFANIEYGYAITSHKAQGSTYNNVYVMEDNIMGSSNAGNIKAKNQSLYVAVSRPTTKLVMVTNLATDSSKIETAEPAQQLTDLVKPKFNPFDGRNLNPNDLIDEQLLPLQEDLEEFKRMCK